MSHLQVELLELLQGTLRCIQVHHPQHQHINHPVHRKRITNSQAENYIAELVRQVSNQRNDADSGNEEGREGKERVRPGHLKIKKRKKYWGINEGVSLVGQVKEKKRRSNKIFNVRLN